MAYLNKQQYEARERNAARRNAQNEEIGILNGMTEEQAELITDLCSLRHELHSSIDSLIKSETDMGARLIRLNAAILESGLDCMDFIPTDEADYIDIDSIEGLHEYGEVPVPEDDDERQEWYNSNYERIYDDWENLNSQIEGYLRDIDKRYGTAFAPTGKLRIF